MTLLYLVSALMAAGAYFLTRRLRRWLRIAIALTVFIVLAVLPTVLLLISPDHRLPGARTVTQEELDRAAAQTSGGRSAEAGITGYWLSDPYQTQLGRATTDFCFRPDGTYVSQFRSEGATFDEAGRYRMEGRQLVLEGDDGTFFYDFSMPPSDDLMLVNEGEDELRTYRRTKDDC